MKALKQKRISLRSLWRRGLVILSLFALVFASCSDSGSDGDDSSGSSNARVPYSIEIVTHPTAKSYMGLPVDLSGIKVLARYADGEPEELTDPTLFDTIPRYAEGEWDTENTNPDPNGSSPFFIPLRQYALTYAVGNRVLMANQNLVIPSVEGIVRPNTAEGENPDAEDPVNWAGAGIFSSQGLQVVSLGTTRTWYVDDQVDFSGITCEAVYEDGARKRINLTPDMPWQIIPHYNNGNNTGVGSLYVTVGRSFFNEGNYDGDSVNGDAFDPGVTAIIPLEQVYHVTKLEVKTAPKLDPFFYWEKDVYAVDPVVGEYVNPWLARVKDAVLLVTYSNNKTKEFTIEQALRQNEVWYNANPGEGWTMVEFPPLGPQNPATIPFDVIGIYLSAGGRVTGYTNGGVTPTLGVAKNIARLADPVITFYYRGAQAPYKVPVYANFTQLTATLKGGANVEVDMRQNDNDFRDGMTAEKFASMVDVVATFTAFSTDVPVQKTLTYYTYTEINGDPLSPYSGTTWENYNQSNTGAGVILPSATPTGFEYTMDFGSNAVAWGTEGVPANINTNPRHQPDSIDDDKYNAGTWASKVLVPNEWTRFNWGQSDNPGNNNKSTAITFYYTAPAGDEWYVGNGTTSTVAQRTRNARTNVMFRNLY